MLVYALREEWKSFIRSGGKITGGYIKNLTALCYKKVVIVRVKPSLVSQLKCIKNGLLAKMERSGIEKMVKETSEKWGARSRRRWWSGGNVLFGESDGEDVFVDFEAENDLDGAYRMKEVVGSENKVDFKVADGGDDVKGEETKRLTVCSLCVWKGWLRFLEMMVLKWQLI